LPFLQADMYTVKVVVSKKWCMIDTLLLHATNKKYHMALQFVSFPVTLKAIRVLQDLSYAKYNLMNICICATFYTFLTDTARYVVP